MSHREYTESTALKRVRDGNVKVNLDSKEAVLEPDQGASNSVWGALDYLRKKHNYVVMRSVGAKAKITIATPFDK